MPRIPLSDEPENLDDDLDSDPLADDVEVPLDFDPPDKREYEPDYWEDELEDYEVDELMRDALGG